MWQLNLTSSRGVAFRFVDIGWRDFQRSQSSSPVREHCGRTCILPSVVSTRGITCLIASRALSRALFRALFWMPSRRCLWRRFGRCIGRRFERHLGDVSRDFRALFGCSFGRHLGAVSGAVPSAVPSAAASAVARVYRAPSGGLFRAPSRRRLSALSALSQCHLGAISSPFQALFETPF